MADAGFLELEHGTEPPSPSSGFTRVYTDTADGLVKRKNSAGQVAILDADATTDDVTEGVTNLYFTNERAQDAVGTTLTDTAEIDLTYNDGANTITADLIATTVVAGSYGVAASVPTIVFDSKGRATAASNTAIAITSSQVTDFNEAAQDAVGAALTDTAEIDLTYNDGANTITADLIAVPAAKITGVLDEPNGGTNQSTYATGDTLYASASNTLSKRTIGGEGQTLRSVAGVPNWEDQDHVNQVRFFEDWLNGPEGSEGWTEDNSGALSDVTGSITLSDSSHPGVLTFTTGTTTTGRAGLNLGGAVGTFLTGIHPGNGILKYETLVRFEDLSTVGEEYFLAVGMTNATTGVANGIYFQYSRTTSVNWLIVTVGASVATVTTTSIAVTADVWHKLRVEVNAAASSVEFFINDVSAGTITTNIPTAAIAPSFRFGKSAGITARLCYADYFKLFSRMTTGR